MKERGTDVLLQQMKESLSRQGIPQAEQIALRIVADVRRNLAGECVYVDKGFQHRNEEIKSQWNGRNRQQLAHHYGISHRRIDQIIKNG